MGRITGPDIERLTPARRVRTADRWSSAGSPGREWRPARSGGPSRDRMASGFRLAISGFGRRSPRGQVRLQRAPSVEASAGDSQLPVSRQRNISYQQLQPQFDAASPPDQLVGGDFVGAVNGEVDGVGHVGALLDGEAVVLPVLAEQQTQDAVVRVRLVPQLPGKQRSVVLMAGGADSPARIEDAAARRLRGSSSPAGTRNVRPPRCS